MHFTKLYKNKKYDVPIVSIIFMISILVVTIPTYFNRNLYEIFAGFTPKPLHWWQYVTSSFEHVIYGYRSYQFIWIHMGTNLSVVLLFGLIVEKMMGQWKTLQLLVYIYILEITFICGVITAVSTWKQTTLYHFAAIMIGLIFLLINRKSAGIEYQQLRSLSIKSYPVSKVYYVLFLVPISMLVLVVLGISDAIPIKYQW